MEIQEIKQQLTIGQVLEHYGLKANRNKMLCCPFHDDKTPSMQVYTETNTVFCFSSNCKLHGKAIDQIDFILHHEKCTKHEAILKAKTLIGNTIIQKVEQKHQEQTDYQEIFPKLQAALTRSKKAIEYLKSRSLSYQNLEVGYNGGTHFKSLKHCIIFPLKDESGNITSLYGRAIAENGKHYYTSNRKGLYPNYPKAETQILILSESIIDTATINSHTDYKALALYGTNGLTEEHKTAIQNLTQLKEVILFFDGDEAGEMAAEKYSKELHELKPQIKISKVITPQGEDANSLVIGHEPEILSHLIENRTNLFSSYETSNEEKNKMPAVTHRLNTKNSDYLTYENQNLLISILGGIALHPLDKLKVTLKIERTDSPSPLHSLRHSLDLYNDDQTEKLIRKAAERLETGSREIQSTILQMINEIEQYRLNQIEKQKPKKEESRTITEARKQAAIQLLKSKNLLKKTNELIGKTGMVGEEVNRLLMYLVFTSRLREQPLHIISLGASGTGKTYLQEKISELISREHKLEITALSENALYYFDRTELKHKLILIEDLDGANDDKILYAIRELMSKRRISKTIPIKDSKGNLKTITLQVEGPICLAGTTTREKLYEDNANRSILIYLDGSRKHKEQIMDYQRAKSAGQINKTQEAKAKQVLQDVQSILRPITVRNPYATKLKIPQEVFKPLRTNTHYLAFIETVTFYHQWQRPQRTDEATGEKYIETTLEDIAAANGLLKDVLLAKSDELTNACRTFLERLKSKLTKENKTTFYRSEIREWMRINPHNLRHYLSQLQQYGYVKIIGGNRYKQGYEYELTSKEEYQNLQNSIQNALDQALEKVKSVASVANSCELSQLAT